MENRIENNQPPVESARATSAHTEAYSNMSDFQNIRTSMNNTDTSKNSLPDLRLDDSSKPAGDSQGVGQAGEKPTPRSDAQPRQADQPATPPEARPAQPEQPAEGDSSGPRPNRSDLPSDVKKDIKVAEKAAKHQMMKLGEQARMPNQVRAGAGAGALILGEVLAANYNWHFNMTPQQRESAMADRLQEAAPLHNGRLARQYAHRRPGGS